jgi:hypothetical protein
MPMSYEFITLEQKGPVGVITLNRAKQLNADIAAMKDFSCPATAARSACRGSRTRQEQWISASRRA